MFYASIILIWSSGGGGGGSERNFRVGVYLNKNLSGEGYRKQTTFLGLSKMNKNKNMMKKKMMKTRKKKKKKKKRK